MIGRYTSWMQKLPRPVALAVKRAMVRPRHARQKAAAEAGYREHGGSYPHSVLFVAGMPKSGSTWLENLVASCPGYAAVLPPEATFDELRGTPGHLFEMPAGLFDRYRDSLVLAKMHCPGTPGNVAVLREAGIPAVVLYRDPRDVAVSYLHYVRQTPWHLDWPILKEADAGEGIDFFIARRLPEFAAWMRSWRDNRDPETSLMLSYEEMLADTRSALLRVFSLYGLPLGGAVIDDAVAESEAAKGRGNHFRKGVAGDWRNHFDAKRKEAFREAAGGLLEEFGYETE